MATKKAPKVLRKASAATVRSQKPAQRAASGSSWLLGSGLVVSSLILIAVFFFYPVSRLSPDSKSRIAQRGQTAQRQDRLSELPRNSLSATATGANLAPASMVKPAVITIPIQPRTIDTKTEQDQLLAKVEKVVIDFPQSADAMHVAAITYSELLQTEKAAIFFAKSLALNNRSSQVVVDYSRLLLQTGKQQAAVDLLEPIAGSFSHAAIIDTLGNAYMQLGELEKAAETLDAGAKFLPNDSAIQSPKDLAEFHPNVYELLRQFYVTDMASIVG